jgi:hypothetical protein
VTEAEWLACDAFERLFRHLETTDLLAQRKLRLFEVAYCQRFALALGDPVLENALSVAERFADGLVTGAELAAVHDAARGIEDEYEGRDDDTDALHYGAKAVREATSPDHADYHYGTLDMIEHAVSAVAYASPSYPKGNPEAQPAHFEQVNVAEQRSLVALVHEVFGSPFRPVAFSPEWRTDTVVALARQTYEARDFGALPILADALEEAGCSDPDLLGHLRSAGPHVRGCWALDLILGKE